jgi:hypothetical protein
MSSQSAPSLPAAPTPANTVIYDNSGNVAGQYTYDSANNTYSYKPAQLTAAQQDQQNKNTAYGNQLLSQIASTPQEYVNQANTEAQNYAASVQSGVNTQYKADVQGQNENMAARGMAGSKAYADAIANMGAQKLKADAQIQENATSLGTSLLNNMKQNDINAYNTLLSSQNADVAKQAQVSGLALNSANDINSTLSNNSAQNANNILTQYGINSSNQNALYSSLAGAGGYAIGGWLGGKK